MGTHDFKGIPITERLTRSSRCNTDHTYVNRMSNTFESFDERLKSVSKMSNTKDSGEKRHKIVQRTNGSVYKNKSLFSI